MKQGGSHTHRRPSGAAGDQQSRQTLAGQRGGGGPQVDTGTPPPLFSRVTVPLTHHARQTLCFPVGQLREVNRKPGQAGQPGHHRSPSSRTLCSTSGGEGRESCLKELNVCLSGKVIPQLPPTSQAERGPCCAPPGYMRDPQKLDPPEAQCPPHRIPGYFSCAPNLASTLSTPSLLRKQVKRGAALRLSGQGILPACIRIWASSSTSRAPGTSTPVTPALRR